MNSQGEQGPMSSPPRFEGGGMQGPPPYLGRVMLGLAPRHCSSFGGKQPENERGCLQEQGKGRPDWALCTWECPAVHAI